MFGKDDKNDEEVEKLREEVSRLREELRRLSERIERRPRSFVDIGERISDYVEEVIEGVMEGIAGELEKSILIGPHGIRIISHHPYTKVKNKIDLGKVASVMDALSNEYRLKILKALMSGGKYVSELQEKLGEVTSSTLLSHLDALEKAGLVVQEKTRGRYLITLPGRIAYKMALRISRFFQQEDEEL